MVEFGTLKREEVQRANMAGRWLRYHGAKDPALEQSREILDRGIAGIGG